MAPEIIQAKEYGKQVDIWALGVLAYILFTGQPPFFGKNKSQIFQAVLHTDFKNSNYLSGHQLHFIAGCLDKNPLTRKSAAELLQYPIFHNIDTSNVELNEDIER